MVWRIDVSPAAEKALAKIAPVEARRIAKGLREVAAQENPRLRGKAMAGNFAGHWRYRFGDYRVIARIEDDRLVIVVVALGHRRDVYR